MSVRGAGSGLKHARSGEHVAFVDDLSCVLRVDDLGTARHGQHVVHQQGAQCEIGRAVDRLDDAALVGTDQIVVNDSALVRVVFAVRLENDRVVASLAVGQLYSVADAERT